MFKQCPHSQNLAAQRTYNHLDMTMQEAIRRRAGFVEGVIKCYPDETLDTIIERIVNAEVHMFEKGHKAFVINVTSLLVLHLLVPGPSPGPGGQGWCGEGHHLSFWPAAGHGFIPCRHWCPLTLTAGERGHLSSFATGVDGSPGHVSNKVFFLLQPPCFVSISTHPYLQIEEKCSAWMVYVFFSFVLQVPNRFIFCLWEINM